MQKPVVYAGVALFGLAALASVWIQQHQTGELSGQAEGRSAAPQTPLGTPLHTGSATTAAALSAPSPAPNDIDGDGRSDLLLENRSFNLSAYWIMDGAAPSRYSPAFTPPIDHVQAATGDFNGDGKLDIVWATPYAFTGPVPPGSAPPTKLKMWLGDGNGFTSVNIGDNAAGWAVSGAGDIDGDGKSDLLLLNAALRYFAYWTMDGARVAGYSAVFARPVDTVLATTGDFNGDGKLDLVWEKLEGGDSMWLGSGTGFQSMPLYARRAPTEAFIASGDVNADGKSDLLVSGFFGRLTYAIMDGAKVTLLSPQFERPAGFTRPIPGDYNGDRKLDLIWERSWDRTLVYWQGDGSGFSPSPVGGYSPGWQPVNVARRVPTRGDIDGDRRSDLVLVNDALGLTAYWAMNGARVIRYSDVFTSPQGHRPMFNGEFNGDGLLDIVWFRDADKHVVLWTSDGVGFNARPIGQAGKPPFVAFKYYNGYERDTLYIYDYATDTNYYWRFGDFSIYGPEFTSPTSHLRPVYWRNLVAVGNFDRDSGWDTVKYSTTARTLGIIGTAGGGGPFGPVAEGWAVVGAGDIDGDEGSDLIFENVEGIAYWIMRDSKPARYSPGFLRPSGYTRVAMADYNGDSKLDIVWARESDRSLLLWQGDGEGFVQASIGNYSAGWRVFGKDSAIRYTSSP